METIATEARVDAGSETRAGTFQKILVATDFSDASRAALDAAIYLASKLGASVTVMHAYSLPVYAVGPLDGVFFPTPEDIARVGAAAQRHLDAELGSRASSGVPLVGVLRYGEVSGEILSCAATIGADLIAMGTHGHGLVARALLGSVAQHVVRTAKQPVLVVPSPAR